MAVIPLFANPTFRQYFAAICWNLGGFNLGIFLGWSAVTTPMLQSQTHPAIGRRPISSEDISYSTALPFAAGLTVSFLWGYIANNLGRKIAGYLTAMCFILCYGLTMKATSVHLFIVSRIIGGMAYCSVLFNGPMYIAEIAEPSKIGRLSGTYLLLENFGTLLVYIIGYVCSFHTINTFCLVVASVSLVTLLIFPESPVFYLKNDRDTEARLSLEWYRSAQDRVFVDDELIRLQNTFLLDKKFKIEYIFTKHTLMALFIAIYLQWAVQTTGINYTTMYTTSIFLQSSNVFDPYVCTIITGVLNSIAPVMYFLVTNKVGRRVILMVSYGLQCVILGTLGLYYYCLKHYFSSPDMYNYVPVLCISLYFLTYSAGAGPVPFTIYSEIFSSEVRNAVVPMIYVWNGLASFLVLKFIPTVVYNTVHMYGVFWFFSISTFMTVIFTFIFIPETKGKPFAKVIEDLTNKAWW